MKSNVWRHPVRFCKNMAVSACLALTLSSTQWAAAAPAQGGTLIVAQTADAQPGNVQAVRAGNTAWVKNVFETLISIDASHNPQPLLATAWKLSSDGLSMSITLRDDVTFQSGRKMTASDVKFSFEYAVRPTSASQLAFIGRQITAMDVGSPTQITLRFAKPLSNIFDFFNLTVIVDKDSVAGLADGSKVIGTGPFVWQSWQPGGKIVLKKYAGYRDAANVYLDGIELPIIADSTAQLTALRGGRAQVGGVSITDAQGFEKDPRYKLVKAGGGIFPLGLNVTTKPFTDVRVRQAVAYAIDRERINSQVFGGLATISNQFWSPTELNNAALQNRYSYDPEKAKKLIAEAGAIGAEVAIVVPAIPSVQSEYEIVRNNLQAIGLKVSATPLNVGEFDARQVAGNLGQAFLLVHGQVGFGAATMLSSLPSLRASNPSKFASPEYDKLRTALDAAGTPAAKSAALAALSGFLLDQAFTLPLVQAPGVIVTSAKVQGLHYDAMGFMDAVHTYLNK